MILDGIKYKRKVYTKKRIEDVGVTEYCKNAMDILNRHGINIKNNNHMKDRAIEKCKGDVLEEYVLIKQKKSKLSLGERNWIVRNFERNWEVDND